jgi:hypothetical protein
MDKINQLKKYVRKSVKEASKYLKLNYSLEKTIMRVYQAAGKISLICKGCSERTV